MAEYIEREAVLEILSGRNAPWGGYNAVKILPTADVVPVVHGKWIDEGQYADYHPQHALRCSVCGDHIIVCLGDETNYCSYCGARMME